MSTEQMGTYEKIYFALWELGQRYGNFVQFRVIGRSHDDRMIPMLEIGKGDTCIICLSGVESGDRNLPEYLLSVAKDYCRSYEICEYGYGAIHNPIHRQMLKMQDRPVEEYECNARGIDLRRNFPTNYYQRKRVNQEPASENETRALISIFQEYSSLGLLTFSYSRGKIVYCRQEKGFAYNQKNYRLARHLQKCSGYRLEKGIAGGARVKKAGAKPEMGSPEQFYAEVIRQPSLAIEIPEYRKDDMEELRLIPLEYLYSLNSGILANA